MPMKGMARGGIGTAERQRDKEARPVLQPGNFGRLCPGSGLKGKGTGARQGKGWSPVPPCHRHCRLSGDPPDARKGGEGNASLQEDRGAIVAVPV